MRRRTFIQSLVGLSFAIAIAQAGFATALADEIRVFSTGAFKEALDAVAPAFEKSSGHKVVVVPGSINEIVKRVGAGEKLDVIIAPISLIEQMIQSDVLLPDSRVNIAKSGIGVAARMGAAKIDISTSAAFKQSLLGAKSIALSAGVSGIYLNGLFHKWGIAQQINAKSVTLPGAVPVANALVRGEIEIGFLQVSELLPVKGIQFIGPLPTDIQEMTPVTAALSKTVGSIDAARAFVTFLKSPEALPMIKTTGLEPN